MSKQDNLTAFDPNGLGQKNGKFIGLPYTEEDARIVLLPVAWDVTVSYGEGTAMGAQNILEASAQLDLYDPDVKDAWKMGIYMRHLDLYWVNRNQELRPKAGTYLEFLETGGALAHDLPMLAVVEEINNASTALNAWVFEQTADLMRRGKLVGVVGGEHSVPLGFLQALAHRHGEFGVLQIDAHQDMRKAYEGFTYSHASIFYNALKIKEITKLVQVGIRDTCEEEIDFAARLGDRVQVWHDQTMQEEMFGGATWRSLCEKIIADLPAKVYVSFDIDGLKPDLCPNTGTPVPGGLEFPQAMFLLKMLADSGREIIGFDLCEVAGVGCDWDGNVGARVLYKLCNLMGKSVGLKVDN